MQVLLTQYDMSLVNKQAQDGGSYSMYAYDFTFSCDVDDVVDVASSFLAAQDTQDYTNLDIRD